MTKFLSLTCRDVRAICDFVKGKFPQCCEHISAFRVYTAKNIKDVLFFEIHVR